MEDNKEKNDFYREIGNLIRILRKKHGWSQEHLAEKVDVSGAFLSNVERGKSGMDTYVFVELCKALGTTPSRLLAFDVELSEDEFQQYFIKVAQLEEEKRDIIISTIKSMLKELDKGIEKVKQAWDEYSPGLFSF